MKGTYNVAHPKNQPCPPAWEELYFIGKVEDDVFCFYVYYDPNLGLILDYPEPLEEKP